jgi:hypothetical protein
VLNRMQMRSRPERAKVELFGGLFWFQTTRGHADGLLVKFRKLHLLLRHYLSEVLRTR